MPLRKNVFEEELYLRSKLLPTFMERQEWLLERRDKCRSPLYNKVLLKMIFYYYKEILLEILYPPPHDRLLQLVAANRGEVGIESPIESRVECIISLIKLAKIKEPIKRSPPVPTFVTNVY
jgi:hypothetical protein